ncbi:unnamed protein product, partial [Didymodactylos carnosus]
LSKYFKRLSSSNVYEEIKYYYDYKSPFTYLSFVPTIELEKFYRIKYRFLPYPFSAKSFGGKLEERSERDWAKVRYLYIDARRFANERGLIIRGPKKFFNSYLSLISGLYADQNNVFVDYSKLVFERFFKRELDIENIDELIKILNEVGLHNDNDFRHYVEHKGRIDFSLAAKEAEQDNVFGVPMLIIRGEPFWGNDRMEWVKKKLDKLGLNKSS